NATTTTNTAECQGERYMRLPALCAEWVDGVGETDEESDLGGCCPAILLFSSSAAALHFALPPSSCEYALMTPHFSPDGKLASLHKPHGHSADAAAEMAPTRAAAIRSFASITCPPAGQSSAWPKKRRCHLSL